VNRRASLSKRIRTASGPRYCPVVVSPNGRIKPDWVLVDGRQERHTEGAYYVSWYAGKKLVRRSVGKDAAMASAELHKQKQILSAQNAGVKVVEEKNDGTLLATAVDVFVAEIKISRKPKTDQAYKQTLDLFLECCPKRHVEEVERDDLIKFAAWLRDARKLSPRTVWNKFGLAVIFLKKSGRRGLVAKSDWPQFVEAEPEMYEQEDLDAFFAACEPDERVLFETFLMSGLREQEVEHLEWTDVNFARGTLTVRQKPQYGFIPKTYEEREVPIPDKLVTSLKRWKQKSTSSLVFPASNGDPDGHLLRYCKAVAKRSGLDSRDWWLHKFRSTFATTALRGGVDLRTVQLWLGHKNLQSTMRYLKPARGQAVRAQVNALF